MKRQRQREEEEAERRAKLLPINERNGFYRTVSQQLTFNAKYVQELERKRGRSKKQTAFGGNGPHLPNGELPIAVWKHPKTTSINEVWLCEGLLKSMLVALQLWEQGRTDVVVIGTAQSARYGQQTLKEYLHQLGAKVIRLMPDAGAIKNPLIHKANTETLELCQEWGYPLTVGWWNQIDKTHDDIDELADFDTIEYLEPYEFLELAKSHGCKLPERVIDDLFTDEPDPELYAQFEEQQAEQERVEELEEEFRGFSKVKQFLKRLKPKRLRFELPPPKEVPDLLRYVPGNLPWQGKFKKCPQITYQLEQLPQLLAEAREKGWQDILDSSATGTGKSFRYAAMSPSTLGVGQGGRCWLLSQSHRNPTTEPAEKNYADMVVRTRTGFVTDHSRTTATGTPYRRYPTKEEAKSLKNGNCILADLIHTAESKGITSATNEAKINPFCHFCAYRDACKKGSGQGFGFRSLREQLFESQQNIRSGTDSSPDPTKYSFEDDVATLDEPLQMIKPAKTISTSLQDFDAQWGELEYFHSTRY